MAEMEMMMCVVLTVLYGCETVMSVCCPFICVKCVGFYFSLLTLFLTSFDC